MATLKLKKACCLALDRNQLLANYETPVCPADFFPMLEVLEGAIKSKGQLNTTARVFVDGIDRQKASELTNALRVRGVSLEKVRSWRDESEPMIRLADMWAGCIRAARGGSQEEAKRKVAFASGPRLFVVVGGRTADQSRRLQVVEQSTWPYNTHTGD